MYRNIRKYTTCVVKIILRPRCLGQLTVAKALHPRQDGRKEYVVCLVVCGAYSFSGCVKRRKRYISRISKGIFCSLADSVTIERLRDRCLEFVISLLVVSRPLESQQNVMDDIPLAVIGFQTLIQRLFNTVYTEYKMILSNLKLQLSLSFFTVISMFHCL